MAKSKDSYKQDEYKSTNSVDTAKNFSKWKSINGFKDKDIDQFKAMSKVRENYERSRNFLMSSCFWDAYQENRTGVAMNGGSWYDRWTLQEKMALMWYRKPSSDEFLSNIKAPMSRGRINTFVNWMKKINIEASARPNNEDDVNAAFMADKVINWWIQNSNFHQVLGDAWEDLATHGNTYIKTSYVQEYHDYRFPKTTPEELDDEEKEELSSDDKKKQDELIYGDPQKTLVIDDVVIEHVPLQEIYPQPGARNFHGDTYRAGWIIRKRYVTLDYFHSIFDDRPHAVNQDKVKGAVSYRDVTEYFFQPPRDTMGTNIVELMEMEDQDNDCYYVIANDIPILGFEKEEPLPDNHKQISYHKLDFIRIPGQFFSMGICDLLDNIQGSYEIAMNMIADYLYRTYNYRLLVDGENMGEIKQALLRTGDSFIPIDTSDGKPLSSKVMPLPVTPVSMDIFNFLEVLERMATLATNIDPAQMAQLAGSKTATSDMLNKELLMTMIGGVIENNVNGDLRSLLQQVWKLQQQHYPKMRVKKILGDDKEDVTSKAKTIRFQGIEVKLNENTKLLEANRIDPKAYSFFQVTDKYISSKDEVDIFITPESKEISSQSADEQRMETEFAQLIPFAVDPNNPQQVQASKMPMVDATELFNEYINVKKLPEKLLLNKGEKGELALKQAEDDVMAVIQGKMGYNDAVPGQSGVYLEYLYNVLDGFILSRDNLLKKAMDDLETKHNQVLQEQQGKPRFDPMTGQPIPVQPAQPDPKMKSDLEDLDEMIETLKKFVTIAGMPAAMRNSRVLQMAKDNPSEEMLSPGTPPAPPGMAPAPDMGGQMPQAPMPGGMNQISPGMINSPNPAGAVPLPPQAGANMMMPQQ